MLPRRGRPDAFRQPRVRSRIIFLILALFTAAAGVGLVGVSPAQADTTPTILGTNWLHGTGVNACDNSAGGSTCGGDAAVGSPWQCVELAQRLYYRRGWYTANGGYFPGVSNAYQIYGQASAMGMSAQANGSITSIVPGDMIIHGQGVSGDAGHVAVVDYIGTDGVHVVEQNYNNAAHQAVYGFSNGTLTRTLNDLSGHAMPILGVVHSPNNTNNQAPALAPVNDFDGDHHTDLMFLHRLGDNKSANMYIYDQAQNFGGPGRIREFANSPDGWNWNSMQIATGDANGDGISDLFMLHQTADGPGGGPGGANLYVFYGGTEAYGTAHLLAQFPYSSNWRWSNMKLLVGDFDGDGHADVMIMTKDLNDNGFNMFIYDWAQNYQGPGLVRNFPGSTWNWSQTKFAIGDSNGDGISDLFMLAADAYGGANLYVLKGGTYQFADSNPVTQFPSPNWSWSNMDLLVGDFDGDHHVDAMIMTKDLSDNGSNMYIYDWNQNYLGPGLVRNFPASTWNWNNMKLSIGDVNNDGISDLLMLYQTGADPGTGYQGANFYVFYGGSSAFADPASPAAQFPGSQYWSWAAMLAPMFVSNS